MKITTTVDEAAGTLTVEIAGRVGLLPPEVVSSVVADTVALALVTKDEAWPGESQWRAIRLLRQGMTDQQVADTIGVHADQVRRWDDDAALDGERDQLADGLGAAMAWEIA